MVRDRACAGEVQLPLLREDQSAAAPFHAIARGFAGPSLLAMILVDKYANHQPLNHQSDQFAREGIELSVSTMADHIGACAATLMPLYELIKAHVFAAERIHGDDTTVPVLAKLKTRTGRIWTYVRDDRPFGGKAPPAAVFFYSPDRARIHPEQHLAGYRGILQADAYAGFNTLYAPDRRPGPITEAGCWAHARRKLFELADVASNARKDKPPPISPIAFQAVRKFDAIFMLERSINGLSPAERVTARRRDIAPLVNDLIEWMKRERTKLSRHNEVAKAMYYMLKRIDIFTRFLEDGRICLSNNAAERELRGIALGRKSWLFAGSDRGGERAAVMLTLIQTALCRARHKAVYADIRTMPNDFGSNPSLWRICEPPTCLGPGAIRHSLALYSASRKARRRSFARKREGFLPSYGLSFAKAASFNARCACR
jgi:transposase